MSLLNNNMAKKELTAEQKAKMKEEKALAKAEARIAKAGGLIPYWEKMFAKQELNKAENNTVCSEYGAGVGLFALSVALEDKVSKPISKLGKGVGFGMLCISAFDFTKGMYRVCKTCSMSKDIELYRSKHPEEYNKLVEYSRKFVEYYVTRVYDPKSCLSLH